MTEDNVPFIPSDRELPEVNQYAFTETKYACTLVNAYKEACYTTGVKATQEGMLWFVQEAHNKYGYVYGKGWYTSVAMNTIKKIWNEKYPEHKLDYIAVRMDNPIFLRSLQNRNMLGCTYKGNSAYNEDYQSDNILDWDQFWSPSYGHRTSLRFTDGKIYIVDSNNGKKYNIYEIKQFTKLVENSVYYPTFYLWVEDKENSIVSPKKDKETIQELNILSNALSLSWKHLDPENQEKAHDIKVYIDKLLNSR